MVQKVMIGVRRSSNLAHIHNIETVLYLKRRYGTKKRLWLILTTVTPPHDVFIAVGVLNHQTELQLDDRNGKESVECWTFGSQIDPTEHQKYLDLDSGCLYCLYNIRGTGWEKNLGTRACLSGGVQSIQYKRATPVGGLNKMVNDLFKNNGY
jgi:hypothetical protein